MVSFVRAWLVVLTLTGKRREKLRRLMGKAGRISYRVHFYEQNVVVWCFTPAEHFCKT